MTDVDRALDATRRSLLGRLVARAGRRARRARSRERNRGRHGLGLLRGGRRRRRCGLLPAPSSKGIRGRSGSAARRWPEPRPSCWSVARLFASLHLPRGCKPVRDAEKRGAAEPLETVRLSAEQAHRLEGGTLPFGDTPRGGGRVGWYTREPVGVVGAITPYNDPLNLVAHKLAPRPDRRERRRAQARRADAADRAGLRRAPSGGRSAGWSARGASRPRRHGGGCAGRAIRSSTWCRSPADTQQATPWRAAPERRRR